MEESLLLMFGFCLLICYLLGLDKVFSETFKIFQQTVIVDIY